MNTVTLALVVLCQGKLLNTIDNSCERYNLDVYHRIENKN